MLSFKLPNLPTIHTKITDKASAIAYIQDHLPAIQSAVADAVKNGDASWTTSSESSDGMNIEVTTTTTTTHHSMMARAIDGLKRVISGEWLGYNPIKPGTKQELKELDGFRRVMGTETSVQKRSLPAGSELSPDVMKERMAIAAPFLIVFAVILLLVVLFILYGKWKVWLKEWRKDRLFEKLERECWQRGQESYGSMVVEDSGSGSESEDGVWV